MKRILLTSTALVAFAGAAAAEDKVTFSADATVGFNDEFEGGFYADSNLDVTASRELDNGITATLTYGLQLEDSLNQDGDDGQIDRGNQNADGSPNVAGSAGNGDRNVFDNFSADNNVLVTLEADAGRFAAGDVEYAPVSYWNGVTNMAADGFSEKDGEFVVRGDAYFGEVLSVGASVGLGDGGEAGQLGLGASYVGPTFNMAVSYQTLDENENGANLSSLNGDYDAWEKIGVSGGFTAGGIDVLVAFANGSNGADQESSYTSTGVQATMPIQDFTASAFYVMEDQEENGQDAEPDDNYGVSLAYSDGVIGLDGWFHGGGTEEIGVEASYALGGGVSIYGGFIQAALDDDANGNAQEGTETYVAGTYDMGNGAELLVSYGEFGGDHPSTITGDGVGDNFEVLEGTTIQVSMSF